MLAGPFFATGCTRNPVTGKLELVLISSQQEIEMGREAAPQFEDEFDGRVPDAELQSYVSSIGHKIAAASPREGMEYDFNVLASDVANAFALPGGKIYVTGGLMSRMTNERQLAAVLAHEVTHVAAGHSVQAMQRQLGTAMLVELAGRVAGADKAQTAEAVAKIVGTLVNLRYSRQQEYDADSYGTDYLTKAGYNPWGMVELLEVLQSLSDLEPGTLGEMLQTHPLTSKRVENAHAIVETNHPDARRETADPNIAGFLEMRGRLAKYLK
jgi:predicted Zn-dependent protease